MTESMYERGLANRKAVLGAEYVDKSIQSADDFNRPLQELVTTYCWGEIWGREELPRKIRSMLNIAMLTALNRPHELKLHVRGALTTEKQRGRPFPKGQSGNPAGKPKGARHKTTMAVQVLLEGEAEALTRKCIDLAKEGDTTALRLCMERIAPATKSRPVQIDLPAIETADDVLKAQGATIEAMASGQITPDEGATIAGVLDAKRKAIETVQLEERIAKLEQQTVAKQ